MFSLTSSVNWHLNYIIVNDIIRIYNCVFLDSLWALQQSGVYINWSQVIFLTVGSTTFSLVVGPLHIYWVLCFHYWYPAHIEKKCKIFCDNHYFSWWLLDNHVEFYRKQDIDPWLSLQWCFAVLTLLWRRYWFDCIIIWCY